MGRRTRLYNTGTGKWEYVTVIPVRLKTPWRCLWIWLRAFTRYVRKHSHALPHYPTEWDFDPETMTMTDRKEERRAGRFRRLAAAVLSMLDMQRYV